jgi:hypothetical protein
LAPPRYPFLMRFAAFLGFVALLATPLDVRAQDTPAECHEAWLAQDHWFGRFCRPDHLAKLHHMVGAPRLSSVAGRRRAVRVIGIDGHLYTRDPQHHLIAIDVFEQGDRAVAIVRGQGDGWNNPIIRTWLSEADWAYIAENAARLADHRAIVPWREDEICIHSMEIILETHGFEEPRALFRDLCTVDSSVFGYGYEILERVLAASRECRRIDRDEWLLNRLRYCVEGEPG